MTITPGPAAAGAAIAAEEGAADPDCNPLNFAKMSNAILLTPGFSPVRAGPAGKPLKRLAGRNAFATRLKPGVNESSIFVSHFYEPQ